MKTNKIRPISLALIKNDNKIFVFKAEDKIKNESFYRPLGGGIEFGETSEQALVREFKEEINADIKVGELVKVFENIFTYEGVDMHEIVFLYRAEFIDKAWHSNNNIDIKAKRHDWQAEWVSIEEINKSIIYPGGINKLL